jgi:phosphatidylserine decarboxylase|tara:strand:- start:4299 stop:4958 length:660 start_codon:yes stop_codon:yes gene_type:complete
MTFHREGTATLTVVLVLAGAICFAAYSWLPAWAFYALALGCLVMVGLIVNFFRMPSRTIGSQRLEDVLCPSDGKVVVIEKVQETEWFKDERIQVSIFMSPLNVHAQWSPMAGRVLAARHHPGKYLVAWHPKSSTENERTTHVIEGKHGTVLFRQIAGAVARRICWYLKEGDQLTHGDEVGFIKFGSRIDVFLPLDSEICVEMNQDVVGRETMLARLKSS